MYSIGEQVMYGVHGVCTVVDVEEKKLDGKTVSYLVLEPRDQETSRFYVPASNPNAMAKLHPMLSRQELEALLASEEVRQDAWIEEENQRKLCYREIIGNGDRAALLRMVRTLLAHRKAQEAAGRKFHLCDENFLRDAQRLLSTEFSVVLGIEPGDVENYVLEKLDT